MASRRMISREIVKADEFLDMSLEARMLYFYLILASDDEGFCAEAKSIARVIEAGKEAVDELVEQDYIIKFDSGIVCIKDWYIHNNVRADRKSQTLYQKERALVELDEGKRYRLAQPRGVQPLDNQMSTTCQPNDNQMTTKCQPNDRIGQSSLGQSRLGQYSIGQSSQDDADDDSKKAIPTLEDVKNYIHDNDLNVNAEKVYGYYENKGWVINNEPIADWRAVIRACHNSSKVCDIKKHRGFNNFEQRNDIDFDDLERKILEKRKKKANG